MVGRGIDQKMQHKGDGADLRTAGFTEGPSWPIFLFIFFTIKYDDIYLNSSLFYIWIACSFFFVCLFVQHVIHQITENENYRLQKNEIP